MTCKDKQENNGTCPHHNLQCGWPKCNEPEQGYVGCIPWQWVDKAKQIADGPIAYPDAERAQQAIALIKILLKSTPPQRKPLTPSQVQKIWKESGYDEALMEERAHFINGIRHAEVAHGIKE